MVCCFARCSLLRRYGSFASLKLPSSPWTRLWVSLPFDASTGAYSLSVADPGSPDSAPALLAPLSSVASLLPAASTPALQVSLPTSTPCLLLASALERDGLCAAIVDRLRASYPGKQVPVTPAEVLDLTVSDVAALNTLTKSELAGEEAALRAHCEEVALALSNMAGLEAQLREEGGEEKGGVGDGSDDEQEEKGSYERVRSEQPNIPPLTLLCVRADTPHPCAGRGRCS
jgi:hypothetical protein